MNHADTRIKSARRQRAGESRRAAESSRRRHLHRVAMMDCYKPDINALKDALSARQANGTEWSVDLTLTAHGPAHSAAWEAHITATANNGEFIRFGNTLDGCLAVDDDADGWMAAWFSAEGDCQMFTDPGSAYATITEALDQLV